MLITVIGSAGHTGRHVLDQGRERGHAAAVATALVAAMAQTGVRRLVTVSADPVAARRPRTRLRSSGECSPPSTPTSP